MVLIYKASVNWANDRKYKIIVAMCNTENDSEYESELNFFRSLGKNSNVFLEAKKDKEIKLSSYKLAIESDLTVGMDSSLMMEVFGIKQKVLWGVSAQQGLMSQLGIEMYKEKLPSEVMLKNLTQSGFNKSMDTLLQMTDEQYSSLTKNARKYFMNIKAPYPHKIISRDIEAFITASYQR